MKCRFRSSVNLLIDAEYDNASTLRAPMIFEVEANIMNFALRGTSHRWFVNLPVPSCGAFPANKNCFIPPDGHTCEETDDSNPHEKITSFTLGNKDKVVKVNFR